MGVNSMQRMWLLAAGAVMLVPCAALAQPKSSPQSSCQSRFESLRSIRASLSSPDIYPRIAADLASYERELLARLDKDWAEKAPAGKRPSESPELLRDAAHGRDDLAAVHRTKTDERYKDSSRFFVARNELDSCLLRARLARVEGATQQAGAAKPKEPVPSGPLDQAALNRLSWDELTGVYQRVISVPKPDLEYARRIVQTALRRFPDHKNAPGARSVLAQIEKQLAPAQPDTPPPSASPVPTPAPAPRRAEERPAPPRPAEASAQVDQARLDRMSIAELIALMKQSGAEFQRVVVGKMSQDGKLQTGKLSAEDRKTLADIVPRMKAALHTIADRFPEHPDAADAPAYIAFFTAIERDLGLIKGAVTLASRPDQATLDRMDADELSALFFEFGTKNYPSDASREADLRIIRMVLRTAVERHPDHPFAEQARKVLATDEAEQKRRAEAAAAAALPPPAAAPPAPPAPPAPAAPAAPAAEPSFVEQMWRTLLGWLGLEQARPAGS